MGEDERRRKARIRPVIVKNYYYSDVGINGIKYRVGDWGNLA